jgi:hypothetical protein
MMHKIAIGLSGLVFFIGATPKSGAAQDANVVVSPQHPRCIGYEAVEFPGCVRYGTLSEEQPQFVAATRNVNLPIVPAEPRRLRGSVVADQVGLAFVVCDLNSLPLRQNSVKDDRMPPPNLPCRGARRGGNNSCCREEMA